MRSLKLDACLSSMQARRIENFSIKAEDGWIKQFHVLTLPKGRIYSSTAVERGAQSTAVCLSAICNLLMCFLKSNCCIEIILIVQSPNTYVLMIYIYMT